MDTSLKNRYPFRLGTTSFIYRADWVANVKLLAPLFDEIELLLLESGGLPSRHEINALSRIGAEYGITYNVHLPMDIDPAAVSSQVRQQSLDALADAMDRVAPLKPTTQTLHLPYNQADRKQKSIEAWQARAIDGVDRLVEMSGVDAGKLSIENLDFSPLWLQPVVEAADTAFCVDVGHAVLYGFNLKEMLGLYASRITLIHLHGIADGADHRSLAQLDPAHGRTIAHFLNNYRESVSIEVFSLPNLAESMTCFPSLMALANSENAT